MQSFLGWVLVIQRSNTYSSTNVHFLPPMFPVSHLPPSILPHQPDSMAESFLLSPFFWELWFADTERPSCLVLYPLSACIAYPDPSLPASALGWSLLYLNWPLLGQNSNCEPILLFLLSLWVWLVFFNISQMSVVILYLSLLFWLILFSTIVSKSNSIHL